MYFFRLFNIIDSKDMADANGDEFGWYDTTQMGKSR